MIIQYAHLRNFRNHSDTTFNFATQMNVLLGNNGQGKTNALEALSFFSLTKSFYATSDVTVMKKGETFFELDGTLVSDSGKEFTVRIAYDHVQKEKKYTINNVVPDKLSLVIGKFPVVVLSPENSSITFGAPGERRKFIDLVISQSSAMYTEQVLEYRKILRQRNAILHSARGKDCRDTLAPWNEMLVHHGAMLMNKRQTFLKEFLPYITDAFLHIVGEKETPMIAYASTVQLDETESVESIKHKLSQKLQQKYVDELRFRTTLVGPHRDDILFSLNEMPIKHFASQGQHKTFLVALKAAEFFFLKQRCNETPMFLLDDVFSELDEERSRSLLALVESLGQTFITTTDEKIFGEIQWNTQRKKFFINNGAVINEMIAA